MTPYCKVLPEISTSARLMSACKEQHKQQVDGCTRLMHDGKSSPNQCVPAPSHSHHTDRRWLNVHQLLHRAQSLSRRGGKMGAHTHTHARTHARTTRISHTHTHTHTHHTHTHHTNARISHTHTHTHTHTQHTHTHTHIAYHIHTRARWG